MPDYTPNAGPFARTRIACVAFFACVVAAFAQPDAARPLFNGKDLTGWVNVNCDPSTFVVKDGMIVTTGKPVGYLRTDRPYENFVLEFDWMHQNRDKVGNSGLFVWGDPLPAKGTGYTRGIEVQVLVNLDVKDTYTSHGDLFSIWGATCQPDRPHPKGWQRCLPSENRCKGGGEWNHYKVTANDGVIKLEVNGREVSGVSGCRPRKGYLALESEGAECWFKNLTLGELPSTNPTPDEIADADRGFRSLFRGLDLTGWKGNESWKGANGRLLFTGNVAAQPIWTDADFGDFEFLVDVKAADGASVVLKGQDSKAAPVAVVGGAPDWRRLLIRRQGTKLSVTIDGRPETEQTIESLAATGPIGLSPTSGPAEFMNLFIRRID